MSVCRVSDCCNEPTNYHSDQAGFDRAQNCRIVRISGSLPNGIAGTSYNASLSAFGGVPPYLWSAIGDLPLDLSLTPDGLLSGIIAEAEDFEVAIQVEDSNGNKCLQTLTLSVACFELTIGAVISDDLESYAVGAALDGLFTDNAWCSPFANVNAPDSDTPYSIDIVIDQDDMESYNDGDLLNGLNGGSVWDGAYVST